MREDVRDLERVGDLDKLELLFERLADSVGSLLSVNALREDLEVAFDTVRAWLRVFQRLYAAFTIAPFGPPRIKAVKKSQNLYLWDFARVESAGARVENLVLWHLLRLVHWLEDAHGIPAELRFFRSRMGHEVDAVILRKRRPWMAVEVKSSDEGLDRGLRYLVERVAIPHVFQVAIHGKNHRFLPDVGAHGVHLLPVSRLLANLP
ncbi:MAG: DUF4143 domain-containing protein [Polyangiales bacterium]